MNDETPYDNLWSWLAGATIATSCAVFVFLRTGGTSFWPTVSAIVKDDVMVTVAFWGASLCAAGLLALGVLAWRYADTDYSREGPLWPRFKLLESETRSLGVAGIALAITITMPLSTVVASLYTYISKSRVALWNEINPLGPGFISSRIAASQTSCDGGACFRMHPKVGSPPHAHEWFVMSDILLAAFVIGAVIAWTLFLLRIHRS